MRISALLFVSVLVLSFGCAGPMTEQVEKVFVCSDGSEVENPGQCPILDATDVCSDSHMYLYATSDATSGFTPPEKEQSAARFIVWPQVTMTVEEFSLFWSINLDAPVAWSLRHEGKEIGVGVLAAKATRHSLKLAHPLEMKYGQRGEFELIIDSSAVYDGWTIVMAIDQVRYTTGQKECVHDDVDAPVWKWHYRAQLETYENEVQVYASTHGLSESWVHYMVEHKRDYVEPFVYAREELVPNKPPRTLVVQVSYLNQIAYDPMWSSEEEHRAALKRMLELQFPGWTFIVEANSSWPASIEMVLGEPETSNARSGVGEEWRMKILGTVYLHFETIAAHEIAHLLGFGHHQPFSSGEETLDHPEEGPCIMRRDGQMFGHAERFLLKLDDPTPEMLTELDEVSDDILDRYPRQ